MRSHEQGGEFGRPTREIGKGGGVTPISLGSDMRTYCRSKESSVLCRQSDEMCASNDECDQPGQKTRRWTQVAENKKRRRNNPKGMTTDYFGEKGPEGSLRPSGNTTPCRRQKDHPANQSEERREMVAGRKHEASRLDTRPRSPPSSAASDLLSTSTRRCPDDA